MKTNPSLSLSNRMTPSKQSFPRRRESRPATTILLGTESRFVCITLALFVLGLFLGPASLRAADSADLVKQIKKTLSSVKRRIPTDPARAEKEWLQARDVLSQMKAADPDNKQLPILTKSHQTLGQKLQKRLGRTIGAAKADTKKPANDKKPTPKQQKPAPSELPTSVTSRLTKIDAALDAVEIALPKRRLETARRKLVTADKLMAEIQKRYAAKIPPGNQQMQTATARLETVRAIYAQAQAAAEAKAAAEAAVRAEKEAQSNVWIQKLSPLC